MPKHGALYSFGILENRRDPETHGERFVRISEEKEARRRVETPGSSPGGIRTEKRSGTRRRLATTLLALALLVSFAAGLAAGSPDMAEIRTERPEIRADAPAP